MPLVIESRDATRGTGGSVIAATQERAVWPTCPHRPHAYGLYVVCACGRPFERACGCAGDCFCALATLRRVKRGSLSTTLR
mgnify:CR=1 FL=1